jgi:hypothetical protein
MRKVLMIISLLITSSVMLIAGPHDPYLIGHITTCSGLMDNSYPADSTNWFYRNQHRAVQYWAYLLFPATGAGTANVKNKYYLFKNPYELYSGSADRGREDADNFSFENRWISPTGKLICEKIMTWTKSSSDKRVTVDGKQYIPYTFADFIGINQTFPENGQAAIPEEKGLYHIDLYVNGDLASVTFFEMKD